MLTILRDEQGKDRIQDVALQPVSEVYFGDIPAMRQADRTQIYLLGAVGLIVLLIACSNYVNLATARALERAREVGVRKAVGAGRGQIVAQMVVETLVLTLIALPVGVGLLALGLPLFNTLADSGISLGEVLRPSYLLSGSWTAAGCGRAGRRLSVARALALSAHRSVARAESVQDSGCVDRARVASRRRRLAVHCYHRAAGLHARRRSTDAPPSAGRSGLYR